jgi:hypothetical protein
MSNNWKTEAVIIKPNDNTNHSFSFKEVVGFFTSYNNLGPIRILNDYDKIIMSSASFDFLFSVWVDCNLMVVNHPSENKIENYSPNNKSFKHVREFQKYIGRQGGIKHVTRYSEDKSDGFIKVWKVYFKNGTHVTVGLYN